MRLAPDGTLTARMAMTDIGTGTYTILSQIAAEMLGVKVSEVRMILGDTADPMSSGSGGSFGAASSGSALYMACEDLRRQLLAKTDLNPDNAVFADNRITSGNRTASLRDLIGPGLEAEGEIKPGENEKKFSQYSYGAHFAEVGVDADTGEIRLRRMLGVFTGGRILNPKTARSQAIGGMVFGVGAALMEAIEVDPRTGSFVNHDLAEYHVPVHADLPEIDAVFLPELDDKANPLKSKGLGELGICGAGAAVANAVYNATGIRIPGYPLTLWFRISKRASTRWRRRSILALATKILSPSAQDRPGEGVACLLGITPPRPSPRGWSAPAPGARAPTDAPSRRRAPPPGRPAVHPAPSCRRAASTARR